MPTIGRLSQRHNGVLTEPEQRAFDEALRVVMQDSTARLEQTLRRTRRGGPAGLDPELRRSYERTQKRLAAQARRARQNFPQLTAGWEVEPPVVDEPEALATPDAEPSVESDSEADVGISLETFESEIEQTSDTLEILERIASIELQQLEHQQSQLLRDVRGIFFALLVSVAVIVAGVAPLVQAKPHERNLIFVWTVLVCVASGVGYAVVRAVQSKRDRGSD